jgi:glycosyltransferase involved in cell wall biosynthesis
MKLAIVIPAFNEEATLRDVATRALAQSRNVYVIDDGSTDATSATVADLPLKLIRHAANLGKAASLWDGFAAALEDGADCIATLDGDGQHRPEDVARLLAAAQRHPQRLVIGARLRTRSQAPRARRMANAVGDFCLSWVAGHPIADSQSGQRLYPAALVRAVLHEDSVRHDAGAAFTLESELLIVAAERGYCTVAIPIDTVYTTARASHFRAMRDIARIARMLLGRLIAARLKPRGLWRTLTQRAEVLSPEALSAEAAQSTIGRRRAPLAPSRRFSP